MLFQPLLEQFGVTDTVSVISYPADRFLSYPELVEYVQSQLPCNKPLVIIAESFAGPIGISLASNPSLNIKKLVLVATFSRFPFSIVKIVSAMLPYSLLFRFSVPTFIMKLFFFGNRGTVFLFEALQESVNKNRPPVLARRVREVMKIDVSGLLDKIKLPCLLITASHDRLIPASATRYLADNTRNIDVEQVDGAHFILQTEPGQCFTLIDNWLKRE